MKSSNLMKFVRAGTLALGSALFLLAVPVPAQTGGSTNGKAGVSTESSGVTTVAFHNGGSGANATVPNNGVNNNGAGAGNNAVGANGGVGTTGAGVGAGLNGAGANAGVRNNGAAGYHGNGGYGLWGLVGLIGLFGLFRGGSSSDIPTATTTTRTDEYVRR